jgi:hypothetical protein
MPTSASNLDLTNASSIQAGPASWNWEEHVASRLVDSNGNGQDMAVQDFVEAGTVLIAAAPARIGATPFRAVPIGMIESAVVAHNKPLNRIFEIGSKMSYIVPGRGMGNMQLSRVFFDGDSILKALYWGEVRGYEEPSSGGYNAQFQSSPGPLANGYTAFSTKPWSKRLAIDLMNTFFDRAFGLVFYFCDSQKDTLGIMYFEGCMVSSHSIGITAAANVITEGVAIDFVRARSLAVSGEATTLAGSGTTGGVFSGFNPGSEIAA